MEMYYLSSQLHKKVYQINFLAKQGFLLDFILYVGFTQTSFLSAHASYAISGFVPSFYVKF